jgi:hypothetical protein
MFRWRGQDMILAWYRDGERRRVLPSPLPIALGDDGVLHCRRFTGWDALLRPPQPLPELEHVRSPHGSTLVTTKPRMDGFALHAALQADAARVSLGFGLDAHGGGTFVDLDPGDLRISLRSSARFGLRVTDGEVEVTLDDRTVLLAVVEPRAGHIGLLVDSGEAHLHDARLRCV